MDLSTRGRRSYLARIRQVSLASELRRLLDRERELNGFLEQPPVAETDTEPPPSALHALHNGDVLDGRYEIHNFIAAGGMGEVYRAFDREVRQFVAVKTLRPEIAQPVFMARLRREVQLARRVTHANICRLHDMGRAAMAEGGEIVFITMELLEGRTLAEIVRERPLNFEDGLNIAIQVISGLSAAHESGVIHRDLKSGNILVTCGPAGEKRAIITDFGLAREMEAPANETVSVFGVNAVVGTPAYMSPEQFEGAQITTASDIYSLGVVLFEMISGRLPIENSSPLVIGLRRLREPAPDIRTVAPEVPDVWATAISACLERNPLHRPRSAAEVERMLRGEVRSSGRISRRVAWATGLGALAAAGVGIPLLLRDPRVMSPEAQRHLNLGLEFAKRRTKESLANAVDEFHNAVQLEPAYGDAWSGLADAYSAMANYNFMPPRAGLDQARDAAGRAVQLSPGSGRAHGAMAYVMSIDVRRWLEAGPYFEQSVGLSPRDPLVRLWYGAWLGKKGQVAAALSQLDAGLEQDSASLALHHQRAVEYFWAKRFPAFLAEARELVRLQPYEAESRLILARALEWSGRFDEALKICDEAEKYGYSVAAVCNRGCVESAAGNLAEAEQLAAQVYDHWRKNPFETLLLAQLLSRLRGPQEVLEVLNTGYERDDSTILASWASPYLEKWRQDSGFQTFFRKLGLPV